MECYICFETYDKKSGLPCNQCKKTCCGNCYMKQWIQNRRNPKCGLCRFDDKNMIGSLALVESCAVQRARQCGFNIDEAIEFKKQVAAMRAK